MRLFRPSPPTRVSPAIFDLGSIYIFLLLNVATLSSFAATLADSFSIHSTRILFIFVFTDEKATMNAFATRFGTKLMAPALVGAASGLTLYNASPAFGTTVHAATKPAVDLKSVRQDIADLIEDDAEKRGDGTSLTVCIGMRFLNSFHRLIAVVFLYLI